MAPMRRLIVWALEGMGSIWGYTRWTEDEDRYTMPTQAARVDKLCHGPFGTTLSLQLLTRNETLLAPMLARTKEATEASWFDEGRPSSDGVSGVCCQPRNDVQIAAALAGGVRFKQGRLTDNWELIVCCALCSVLRAPCCLS